MIPKPIQQFIPPVIGKLGDRLKKSTLHRKQFLSHWQRVHPKLEDKAPGLTEIMDKFLKSPSCDMVSDYWYYLNMLNIGDTYGDNGAYIEGLAIYGWDNFKQIINNYFTFLEGLEGTRGYSRNLTKLVDISNVEESTKVIFKKHDFWSWERSITYNITTLLHYYYTRDIVDVIIDEPLLGNPPCIEINGRILAQDSLNSALEYKIITDAIRIPKRIIEYGAGSGRTAYYFMKLHPEIEYTIVDIPPALYLSRRYLSTLLPDAKISYMLPHEYFNAIPNINNIDLTIGISCMQEFPVNIFKKYMAAIQATSKYFYIKMFREVSLPFDEYIYHADSMPIPDKWQPIIMRNCDIPAVMVEHLYKVI